MINCIHRQAEGIKENIHSAVLQVEQFSPLQNEERTQEWGQYLAAIILALIYEPNSEIPEKMRSQWSHHFLKIPPHFKQSPPSKPQFSPPPSLPCTTNTVSTPEIIDLSQDASTPARNPSPTSILPLLALLPTPPP